MRLIIQKHILAFFLIACVSLTCVEESTVDQSRDKNQQIMLRIEKMIAQYDADSSWIGELLDKELSGMAITTLHLQEVFLDSHDHRFLFYVDLTDLFKKGDRYFAWFSGSVYWLCEIYLELECTKEQIQRFSDTPYLGLVNCVIVFQCDQLDRLRVTAEAVSRDTEEALIVMETPGPFLITGKLLDFICSENVPTLE